MKRTRRFTSIGLLRWLLVWGILDCSSLAEEVFPEELVKITTTAMELSTIAYFETPENRLGFDVFQVFRSKLDQAIVASTDNRCYVAFRGTVLSSLWDIAQYFSLGYTEVCSMESNHGCCRTRTGFAKAYYTPFQSALEAAIRTCLVNNNNKDSLVFTGHSQGGTAAQIAGVVWKSQAPFVITFGNEPALDLECVADASRWIRFVNTQTSLGGIRYDWFPFGPRLTKLYNYGYTYIMSNGGVARSCLNSQQVFRPLDLFSLFTFHLAGKYRDRLRQYSLSALPLGYESGSLCTQNVECRSGRCESPPWWLFWKGDQCV